MTITEFLSKNGIDAAELRAEAADLGAELLDHSNEEYAEIDKLIEAVLAAVVAEAK